jgi:hypothetical protein
MHRNKLPSSRMPVAAAAARAHLTVTLQLAYKAASNVCTDLPRAFVQALDQKELEDMRRQGELCRGKGRRLHYGAFSPEAWNGRAGAGCRWHTHSVVHNRNLSSLSVRLVAIGCIAGIISVLGSWSVGTFHCLQQPCCLLHLPHTILLQLCSTTRFSVSSISMTCSSKPQHAVS